MTTSTSLVHMDSCDHRNQRFFFVTLCNRRSRLRAATLRLSELQTKIHSAVTEWDRPAGKDQHLTELQHRSWRKEHSAFMSDLHMVAQQLPEESGGTW